MPFNLHTLLIDVILDQLKKRTMAQTKTFIPAKDGKELNSKLAAMGITSKGLNYYSEDGEKYEIFKSISGEHGWNLHLINRQSEAKFNNRIVRNKRRGYGF